MAVVKPERIIVLSLGTSRKEYPFFMNWLYLTSPGIHYIKSYLEQNGYKAHCIDKVDDNLTVDSISGMLKAEKPEMVLFSQFYSSREEIKQLCSSLPETSIRGIGGHDATFHSMSLNKDDFIRQYAHADFVWQGEIENGFADFIGSYQKETTPVCFNNIHNRLQNLDNLPVLQHDDYSGESAFIVSSRGCIAGGCNFCTTPNFYPDGWRQRSVAHVREELNNIKQSGRFHVVVTDDNFLGLTERDLRRGLDIINYSKESGLKLFIMTSISQILRAEKMGVLGEFRGAVFKVFLGIENNNPGVLKKLGKKVNVDMHANESCRALDVLYTHEVSPHLGFINFNPETTCDELESSARYLYEHHQEASIFYYLYNKMGIFEGTKIHAEYSKGKNEFEFNGGNYMYNFYDRGTSVVFAVLNMVLDYARIIDYLHFEATHLIYMNNLAGTSVGKRYFGLKKKLNEQNFEFFNNALEIGRRKGSMHVMLDLIDSFKREIKMSISDYQQLIPEIVNHSSYILKEPLKNVGTINLE